MFHGDWLSTMLSEFTASALLVGAGFLIGRIRERRRLLGKDLDQYDFYPYVATPVRAGYGVVGAVCINIDINCVRDEVLKSVESTAAFLAHYCQTDMRLDENILSKEEYRLALAGKRHFRDAVVAGPAER